MFGCLNVCHGGDSSEGILAFEDVEVFPPFSKEETDDTDDTENADNRDNTDNTGSTEITESTEIRF